MPEGGGLIIGVKELGVRDGTSPVVTCDLDGGLRTTRKYLIAWDDYADAHWQFLGYSYLGGNARLKRYLPQRDPDFPYLWASRVNRIMGIGWRDYVEKEFGSVNVNEVAAVEVEYMARPYNVYDDSEVSQEGYSELDRFVEIETKTDGDYVSQNVTNAMSWAHGLGTPVLAYAANIGKVVGKTQYVFRWHQIPYEALPIDAIDAAVGHVNNDTLETADGQLTFDPGTLLLLGVNYRIVRMPYRARWGWTVEYLTEFRQTTWNKFYDFQGNENASPVVPPGFYQVTTDGGAGYPTDIAPDKKMIYDGAPFMSLFTPLA